MSATRPWVLGVSASHNGAVCLLHGDEIVVAIQEERLSRLKRHKIFPRESFASLNYCLDTAGITAEELDAVVLCAQGHQDAPGNKIRDNPAFATIRDRVPFWAIPHHVGHALSAIATSGFSDAAVLIVDGVGSPLDDLWESERQVMVTAAAGHEMISLYHAHGLALTPIEKHLVAKHIDKSEPGLPWFGTLGILFGAMAAQMFGNGLEAGKVMGLAPYGKAVYPVADFFTLDGREFRFNARVRAQFRSSERWPAQSAAYQDLAASGQRALEEGLLGLLARLREVSGSQRLCYAGGVALNSIANERIIREAGFDEVFVMPAAEDSGPAIGAAFFGLDRLGRWQRPGPRLVNDAMGREYRSGEILDALKTAPAIVWSQKDDVIDEAVTRLIEGEILGWFQGRSELGPRALGQRSIVMDPRRADGKDVLNARVKFREAFRPFAPAILREHARDWFDLEGVTDDSPFMLRVCSFRPERAKLVPAVVHVDGSGRLQTVTTANGRFHDLIAEFHRRTGVPILLNTSFNVMGEPIVETPEDALWSLLATGIDACVIGDFIATRAASFTGVLDLVPRLIGRRSERQPAASRSDGVADFGEETTARSLHFQVPTRWGEVNQRVAAEYAAPLSFIDGRRDGHQIMAAMADAGEHLNQRFVALALTRLRQARVITFRDG